MTGTLARILVPIDFGAASELALQYALALAARFGASVHLLHVFEDPFAVHIASEGAVRVAPSIREHLIDDAAERLSALLTRRDRERHHVTCEVRVGSAAPTIRDVAEGSRFDLIVMGTHGHTGVARLLRGSVAEQVVREAPCAVLTVHADTAPVNADCVPTPAHDLPPAAAEGRLR